MRISHLNGPAGNDRVRVKCPVVEPGTAVLLILGQSNAANTLNRRLTKAHAGVVNFSIYDGHCYEARDPLVGATCTNGNFATLLGNRLIEEGFYTQVVLTPIAVCGTVIAQWAPEGEHNPRITAAILRLREAGLEPTHVLWHQGEGDCLTPPDTYRHALQGVVRTIRHAGVDAPMFVAQATVCDSDPSEAIRAVQRSMVDHGAGIFAGPDTDQLGAEWRHDRCHFSGEGGKRVAELWLAALTADPPVDHRTG